MAASSLTSHDSDQRYTAVDVVQGISLGVFIASTFWITVIVAGILWWVW